MRKFLFVLMTLISFAVPIQLDAENLSSEARQKIENRVKEYCQLMTLFSGNIENITLLDSIVSMCENNKVQTFDDLTPKEKSPNIEYNSYPLFQYLQNITSKYENSLNFEFSDFACEKVISEPKMNSTGLDEEDLKSGSSLLSNSYALVNVTKHIKGNGINHTVRLRVTVNISNMKIGGTVSQDYEDPYSLYLEGISLINEGKTKKGFELLKRSSSYKTYAGRYRAMTVMGITYLQDKNYNECEHMLRDASEHDPVAGIFLANLYMNTAGLAPKEYFRPYVALQLLEKYARIEDKDYPYAAPLAYMYLTYIYGMGKVVPKDLGKAQTYLQKTFNYLDKNYDVNFLLMFHNISAWIYMEQGNYTLAKIDLMFVENMSNSVFVNRQLQPVLSLGAYVSLALIYQEEGDKSKKEEYINKLKAVGTAKANGCLAILYRNDNNVTEAIKYYRLAADAGDGQAANIMSFYYAPQKVINTIKLSADADAFEKFLYSPRPERDFNKAKYYARIAAENNNIDGSSQMVYYCIAGAELGGEQDLHEGLKWTCVYANRASFEKAGFVAQYTNYFAYQIAQNKDESMLLSVKQLADNNDPACNYILNLLYSYYPPRDTVKAAEYLLKSADSGFYLAMVDAAANYCNGNILKKDPESAMFWYKKMADMNYPAGWSGLAYCEGQFNNNYEKEKEYYLRAFKLRYPDAAVSLAEYHLSGEHSFEKDPAKALYYLEQTQIFCNELGMLPVEKFYPDYEKYVAHAKQEIGGNSSYNPSVSNFHDSIEEHIPEFDALSDPAITPESRISEAEKLLSEIFESSSAVVKTVGSNGTTIIATETASDFIMRLCTSPSKIRIVRIKSHVNNKGQFVDLTVKEVK